MLRIADSDDYGETARHQMVRAKFRDTLCEKEMYEMRIAISSWDKDVAEKLRKKSRFYFEIFPIKN